MVKDLFIEHRGSRLHYARTGNGPRHMVLFHGFGQDMSVFEHFAQSLASHYTFYIFDLYFHGQSQWAHGEETLSKQEWRQTFLAFLQKNNVSRFSVGGFSLGGKFALATLEAFAPQIDKVFLIAPDGIRTSFWYSLATYPFFLRRFFKSMILHPERFMAIAEFLYKRGIVDHGLIRFAEYQMSSKDKRNRVYYSWVVFRHLSFNLRSIASLVNEHHITLSVIVGKYDKVIEPKNMEKFLSLVKNPRFHVLNNGHNGLINQSLPFVLTEVENS